MLEKLYKSDTFMALIYAIGVIVFQMMNVAQVATVGNTLFGTTSHGIWVSTIEIQLMVALQFILGPLAAIGVILSSFAFSLAVKDPGFVYATVSSKVWTLAAAALVIWWAKRRNWSTLKTYFWAWLVGLQVDVAAFVWASGLDGIFWTSVKIRLVLHLALMALLLATRTVSKSKNSLDPGE